MDRMRFATLQMFLWMGRAIATTDDLARGSCSDDLLSTCVETCSFRLNPSDHSSNYNCSLPGLDHFTPGIYEGVVANYLSFETATSSRYFPIRAAELEACTGGKIVFSEAANVFEDPVQDLGTKTNRGSEFYDGYLMSYSHFPEVSSLDLAEHLNERIRKDIARLNYKDILPKVRKMGEYRTQGVTNVDFLMFDGDFFVPIIRLDLLEKFDLPLPNTWHEVVDYAKFFNGTDLNDDGDANDFGFCHFPRVGAGSWDWWFAEVVYSTWATTDQTHGTDQGYFFDTESMEPRFGAGFDAAIEIWKDLWNVGTDTSSDVLLNGRCAIAFGPPGEWKKLFLGEDGVSRKDSNGTVVWRPTMKTGEYAEPYRFKPFGSTSVVNRTSGELEACTKTLCPKAELIPAYGHHGKSDRANVLPASPLEGQLINRAPFYWSGGLGTLIRKSSPTVKKDLLWDFFVYMNSPETSVHDVASYSSWIDSWRQTQLFPGTNFLQAGWSQTAYEEHANIMNWALSSEVNGALNLRIPRMVSYTRDVVGQNVMPFILGDGDMSLDDLRVKLTRGWNEINQQKGTLNQLEVYRASLGLDMLPDVELCRFHRELMDQRNPSICPQYEPSNSQSFVMPLLLSVSIVGVSIVAAVYFHFDRKRKLTDSAWRILSKELTFDQPPIVLGSGAFGSVVLAEFRGTKVAVKRLKSLSIQNSIEDDSPKRRSDGDLESQDMVVAKHSSSAVRAESEWGSTQTSAMKESTSKAISVADKYTTLQHRSKRSNTNSCSRNKNCFFEELRTVALLRHPCICTVMGAVVNKNVEPMLVLEYMEHGSLHDILHNETMPLDGDMILLMLHDIAQGMRFLHATTPAVVHGDLKSYNILIDSRFRAKVADFGLSTKKSTGVVGTPFWMAPELLRGESVNTVASDVYSFGMCLWEMFSRKDPYENEDKAIVLKEVADPDLRRRPPIPPNCPTDIQSIMTDCLCEDYSLRPNFEEVDNRLKRIKAENIPSTMHQNATKNVDLLHKVFPKHIAEALRDGREIEPDKKDCVTVYFSDIVGFTDISAVLSPVQVSDMLNRLYLRLDDLSVKHDVYKMETIGDAYMVVTNLVKEQGQDHVKRAADFAVDVMEAANETLVNLDDPSMGHIQLRAGFHVGPVIARVVGSRNPKYSIFGDTVNTASRMESNSMPGRIQCSEQAAYLLAKQCSYMRVESRGEMKIKGKGRMSTFFVQASDEEDPVNILYTGECLDCSTNSSSAASSNECKLFPDLSSRMSTILKQFSVKDLKE